MPLFGAHMSAAGGPDQALLAASSFGMEACQLFTKNNKQWKAAPLSNDTIAEFARVWKDLGIQYCVAHASYLINLATRNETLWEQSLAALIDELQRAEQLKLDAVVVHPGTASDEDEAFGLLRVAQAVDAALLAIPKMKAQLLLETTAGQGKSIGHSFKQLGTILRNAKKGKKVGVCLDTCHVFSAGYALWPSADYKQTMKEFDDEIGLNRLAMLHVNDSVKGLGCKVDRHAHLGHGSITLEGLKNIVGDKRFKDIPMILETPKGDSPDGRPWDAVNFGKLREMAAS